MDVDPDALLVEIDAQLRRLASKFSRGNDPADALQDARIGAWRAAHRWDPSRGDLMPFVIQRAKGEMLDGLRARTQTRRKRNAGYVNESGEAMFDYSLDRELDADEGGSLLGVLTDGSADPATVVSDRDRFGRVCLWAKGLPEREQAVFAALLDGTPYVDLAERFDVTESRISQIAKEVAAGARRAADGRTDRPPLRKEHKPMTDRSFPISPTVAAGAVQFTANVPLGAGGTVFVAIDTPFSGLDTSDAAYVRTLLEQTMDRLAAGKPRHQERPAEPAESRPRRGHGNKGRTYEKIPCPRGCGGIFGKGPGMAKHLAGGKCPGADAEPTPEPVDPQEPATPSPWAA